MSEILAWLQSERDYHQGVEIYHRHGKSDFYKKLFSSGKTPYNNEKLLAELKLLAPKNRTKEIDSNPTVADQTIGGSQEIKITYSPQYFRIKKTIEDLYNQANRAKHTLNSERNKHVLLKTALMLKKLRRQIRENFQLIDYYDEHGAFPVADQPKRVEDVEDKAKTLQLLLQSNSKAKSRMKSGKCKDPVKTQSLIDENTRLINDLRIYLRRAQ